VLSSSYDLSDFLRSKILHPVLASLELNKCLTHLPVAMFRRSSPSALPGKGSGARGGLEESCVWISLSPRCLYTDCDSLVSLLRKQLYRFLSLKIW
jgi:hypothetical protein